MKKSIKITAVLLCVALIFSITPIASVQATTDNVVYATADDNIDANASEPYIVGELTDKRTENTKHFLMSDRSIMAAVYETAVHYKDNDSWVDIDNSLSTNDENEIENQKNSFKTKFSKKSNGNKLATINKDDFALSWLLDNANKVNAQISQANKTESDDMSALKNLKGSVTYPEIQNDVDLQYIVSGESVKENIILKSADAPTEYSFTYKFNKLKYRTNNKKQIEFYDPDNSENVVFIIDTPYMYDSDEAYSNNIEMQISETSNGLVLTLLPDKEWLLSEDRAYPVVIDPTTLSNQKATKAWDIKICNTQTSSYWFESDEVLVGSNTSGEIYRTLLKFYELPDIGVGGIVVAAQMNINAYPGAYYQEGVTNPALRPRPTDDIQVNIHRMIADWPEKGVTWSGYADKCHPIIDEYFIYNDTDDSFTADITEMVSGWYSGALPNYGIMLKADNETGANHIMQFCSTDYALNETAGESWRPILYVNYRNCVGLENYWSYTTQDMGGYGTGYVNNYNGNLTYIHNDVSFNSLINGFTVSHTYNAANTAKAIKIGNNETALVAADVGYFGRGWGLNLVQKLEPVTIDKYDKVKFVYTDGDGTKHYFVELDGSIVDEDGLGYTVTAISETADSGTTPLTHQITTKDDSILKFDAWGFLRRIVDANGNTIYLHYTPGATMDKNRLAIITTSSGGNITFTYENDVLAYITDNANRITRFSYASGNLTKITYPDGSDLDFAYYSNANGIAGSTSWLSEIKLPNEYRYYYDYHSTGKIKTSAQKSTSGVQFNNLNYTYSNHQTKVNDTHGRHITYQFDGFGRVTCAYDSEGNSYSESYTPNSETKEGIFANNKLSVASGNIKYINNLLSNGAFLNDLSSWGQYNTIASVSEISVVTDQAYISPKSIKIKATGTVAADYINAINQNVSTSTGKTYTLSANIKTENVVTDSSQGAAVKINTNKASYFSEYATGTTNTEINNGFITISKTVPLANDEQITGIAVGLFGASGTLWVDSIQLEEGDTANKINLVENSSFEKGITGYTPSVTNSGSDITNLDANSGSHSLKTLGLSQQNFNYKQEIPISGKAGDVYSFGAWTQGFSLPYGDDLGRYKLVCEFTYTEGDPTRETIAFNTLINDWQYGTKNIAAQNDYTKITLFLCYNKNCNNALFDSLFLYRDTMQSYTYDSNGNVVSTSDHASQQSNYEYGGSSSLSKILNPDGSSYEYLYDSNNNLIASRSNVGVQSDIKYDSHGNAISTQVGANNYSATIQSGKTYYIRLKGSGKYLAVEGSNTTSGTNVCQETFTGNNNQKWRVEKAVAGGYYLYPQNANGMGLGVADDTSAGYANAAIYTHNTSESQRFAIIPQSDYTYKIVTKKQNDGKIITVENALVQNNVTSFPPQGELNADQSWYFEDVSIDSVSQIENEAVYQLKALHSGRYVSVSNQETANGTLLTQQAQAHLDSQKFIIKKVGNNYTLSPLNAPDKHVNVTGTVTSYECKLIEINQPEESDANQFVFEYDLQKNAWQICPAANPEGECFAVAFSDCKDNASVVCANSGTSNNRYFVLEKVSQSITSSATYQNYGNFLQTTTDSRGNVTTYTYDTARGTQTKVEDAKNQETIYDYDPQNDRLNYVKSGNSKVSYNYNNVGMLNSITSPAGTVYNFTYDAFGNTTKISVGSQALTENHYDTTRGLLDYSVYGNGYKIGYTYDILDRVTEKLYNDVTKVKFRYDKFGNLYELSDGFTGHTYRYSYDLTGRIIGIKGSNGIGLDYIYDNLNRVVKYATTFNGITNNTEYVYGSSDIAGQYDGLIYGVKLNGTEKLRYNYDQLARMQNRTIVISPESEGNDEKTFATNYTYLDGATEDKTTTLIKTVDNGANKYEYCYDQLGNITNITLNGVVYESYEYDHLGQLTLIARGGTDFYYYDYDNGGNILSEGLNGVTIKSYTYGDSQWKDKLTAFNGQTITYDSIGNPLQYRDGFNFSWSNGRQLTSINKNGQTINYLYNADGLRTSKNVNGTITDYYWLEGVLLGQKTGNDYIIYLYDENGSAYGLICNNTYYYYVFNAQGDVVGIINSDGTQVVQYDYSAWGEVLAVTGEKADTIGQLNPIRYRGYYYDSETGFYYLQSRYYDPVTQRFLNADGLVSTGQGILATNMFAYCGNNPVNLIDPTGMFLQGVKDCFSKILNEIEKFIVDFSEEYVDNMGLYENPQDNFVTYSEHQKKGTTNPSNRAKHQKGQARRQRDNNGEKKNKSRNWRNNPNKRPVANDVSVVDRVGFGAVAIGATFITIYVIANDITGVGAVDDASLSFLIPIIWDNAAKAFT